MSLNIFKILILNTKYIINDRVTRIKKDNNDVKRSFFSTQFCMDNGNNIKTTLPPSIGYNGNKLNINNTKSPYYTKKKILSSRNMEYS